MLVLCVWCQATARRIAASKPIATNVTSQGTTHSFARRKRKSRLISMPFPGNMMAIELHGMGTQLT